MAQTENTQVEGSPFDVNLLLGWVRHESCTLHLLSDARWGHRWQSKQPGSQNKVRVQFLNEALRSADTVLDLEQPLLSFHSYFLQWLCTYSQYGTYICVSSSGWDVSWMAFPRLGVGFQRLLFLFQGYADHFALLLGGKVSRNGCGSLWTAEIGACQLSTIYFR